MPWAHVTYKCCWSILNHSTNLYSPPSVLCIPTYNVWGYSQSTLISIYAVSSPTFKDLRFLGSYLKAKRPLIYWVSQLVKRPEKANPSFLVWRDMGHCSQCALCWPLSSTRPPLLFMGIYIDHSGQNPFSQGRLSSDVLLIINLHAGLFPNYLFKVTLPMLSVKSCPLWC